MAIYDEDRFSQRVMTWTGGRVAVAVFASIAIGVIIGALFF